ncbi:MAG: hypothetical protein A4E70_00776 [Syntrophus sp. PtaU1.Bin005]|jgi:hypothetical protein|nr:MAG: hypothetical protein A4E69_01652 [Syntrophus sp. PtaB.Bin138]OPY82341.1 MAG: hypothetical protein A4E70_00776 [Syntrophus sp. PtaU1.Bin005]
MNRGKKLGIIAAVVVVLCAALYLGGMWHGRSQVNAQKEKCLQQLKESEARRIAAENSTHLLKARTALFQTLFDLDQRNFGLANGHLREADAPLSKLNAASLGIDKAHLDELRREIAGTNIQVAIDLEVQRNLILNFERRLDNLIPKPAAPFVMPPPMAAPPPPTAAPQATPATPESK